MNTPKLAALALLLPLLSGCATAPLVDSASCRVARLAAAPVPAGSLGGLGMPPTHVTQAEIDAVAACLAPGLDRAFAAVADPAVRGKTWVPMSTAYRASEHGMFLQIYADAGAAESYRNYERGARIAAGGTIVKRSFRVEADGRAVPYRTFVMERRAPGHEPGINDWRFAMFEPSGVLFGETGGQDNARVRFCVQCHEAARAQDFLLYAPPSFRMPVATR
jgi:Cytochrome P460